MTRPPRILLVALAVAAAPTLAIAADADRLRYGRPLVLPQVTSEELVAVPIDAPILGATDEGFADLRILDAQGREVSRVIRRAAVVRRGTARRSFTVESPRLRPLARGGMEIEFTVDPARHPLPVDGFRIETPLRNFEQRVRVERRDEAGAWQQVGDETLLYDSSQFMDTRNLDITFPAEPHRTPGGSWRITIDETTIEQQSTLAELVRTLEGGEETSRSERRLVASQPFRIDSITAWHVDHVAEIRGADDVETPLGGFRVEEDADQHRTRIHVASGREPVTALRLVVEDRNFSRPVRVERPLPPPARSSDGKKADRPRRPLGGGRIHRIDLRGIRQESLTVGMPESRFADYEIVIENGDSQPLVVTGVVASGPAYEAVFLAAPGEDYSLAYGGVADDGDRFPAPRYDTTAIETALAAGQVPLGAVAGPAEERAVGPLGARAAPLLDRLLGNRWVVGGTIALLPGLLAVSLASAARRVDRTGGPPDGSAAG